MPLSHIVLLLGNCETLFSKVPVVQNRQSPQGTLSLHCRSQRCIRRQNTASKHRRQHSTLLAICLFRTTTILESCVSQLPNCFVISDDRRKKLHSGYIFQKKQSFFLFHESACSASEQQGSFGNNSTAPIKKKLKPIIPVGSGPSKLLLVDKETHAPASPIISQTP